MTDEPTPESPPTPAPESVSSDAAVSVSSDAAVSVSSDAAVSVSNAMSEGSPAPVSANTRLLGLVVLTVLALAMLLLWRSAAGKPDTTRSRAACALARPHFAAFQRCLLGAPLTPGEKPGERLRNVVLANETLAPDATWPRRCGTYAQEVVRLLNPVRAEDPRVDRVVSGLWSAHIALSHGRAPTGVDAVWEAAERISVVGAPASSDVPAARAPLHPLSGVEASAALLGPRRERVLGVEASRLLFAGPTLRFCRVQGARAVCADGPALERSVGYSLVPSAVGGTQAQPADVVLARASGAPARLFDAASWAVLGARERVYAAYSQRGGVVVVREGERTSGGVARSIVFEGLVDAGAPAVEVRNPLSLVMPPEVVAGFVYYGHADLRERAPSAPAPTPRGVELSVAWLPADATSPRPPPERVTRPALPVQTLACASDTGRAFAFLDPAAEDPDGQAPRALEVRFYDAQGASRAVVHGELAGTGAAMECLGDAVWLLARKQVAADAHRAVRLGGARCTPAGCVTMTATLARMNDVPDAVTMSDGRVLVVYRTAAAGGLRARIAALSDLAGAREFVLSDEAAYGGIETSRRWLVRADDAALLVLETRAGIVALRIGADGTATLVRP